MNYRYLGRTGLKVSELSLGTMTFGREADEDTSHRLLDTFVDAGGNLIDTANLYAHGLSEQFIGRWLTDRRRDDLLIATKARLRTGDGPNDVGLSRKHLLAAVEASLRRLNTDYIDLYQAHVWDSDTPLEETLSTLDGLVRSGKVRYVGASNFTGWQLQKAVDLSRNIGWEPFACLQAQYSLLCRSTEWELIPVCENEGLGMLAWSPLCGGWLSGKYQRDAGGPPPGTRAKMAEERGGDEVWSTWDNERTWAILDTLREVAQEVGRTASQVAIRWCLESPGVTAPIVGARNLEQLQENLGAVGWVLGDERMARLNEVSALVKPYPYYFVERYQKGRWR